MHPEKVIRERVVQLTDLPNVGKAGEQVLRHRRAVTACRSYTEERKRILSKICAGSGE